MNKTLDLGCGTGRLLDFATSGVDFSEEMLSQAKVKYPYKNLLTGNITEIPFENESLDCIFSFHVIMHQDKEITQQFLSESWQKLKPNGFLIFDFPVKGEEEITPPQKAGMPIIVLMLKKLNFYSEISGLLLRPVEFYFSCTPYSKIFTLAVSSFRQFTFSYFSEEVGFISDYCFTKGSVTPHEVHQKIYSPFF